MDLLLKFKQFIANAVPQLHPSNDELLVAVSGGIDSIVLTDLLIKSKFDVAIAHCNFQLRGAESDRDEAFVHQLADRYGVPLFVQRFNTKQFAEENKLSIQEAARKLRYDWFGEILENKTAKSGNPAYLATAHHADDNVETMLMHFFRGTGIQGLTGMPFYHKERRMVRPLLFASREEILVYANDHRLAWVEDSSNASDKYTRNLFRNKIIPSLKEVFPQLEENLQGNLQRFSEIAELYTEVVAQHKKKLIETRGSEVHIPLLKLQKTSPLKTIIFEIIKEYNFSSAQVDELIKLFDADNGSFIESASRRIIKNRGWLIIAPKKNDIADHIIIEEKETHVHFSNGELHIKKLDGANIQVSADKDVALLDASAIRFPLLLRKWKQGDYFYPLGMKKKKKLSRFFIDQKLSLVDKESAWVLEMDKKIVWVVGHRIDDRFKLTPGTKNVIAIKKL
ncbi:tRNA lysidine(34) synthetase TilS [Danxiaibacter flavus]|uniref:tRNA(Ile)-lysidine synthase n=1 Tax=Danxiaibacter flavus TaxID=3049108 RepID=A0ABV3ZA17_9BACT|nr:tRNA lysidine(34) synthetase TilS [Chitinophagaceae bacterium DXS]